MSARGVWSDEDIEYEAKTLGEIERKIISLCAEHKTFGYMRLAEKTGTSYAEAQRVGHWLQSANLAEIRLLGKGYAGRGIFLNDNGERLRQAIAKLNP